VAGEDGAVVLEEGGIGHRGMVAAGWRRHHWIRARG
jgi:hypothetical protein